MPPRVFISHSSEDKTIADTICKRLESDGIKCWIAPRDIQPGSDWTKAIMQGIEGCQVFILVFSKQANDSDHVYREVAKAFSSRLVVVPFRIEAALPTSGISYYLNTVQWLDAVNPPLDQHISTLIERVKALLAGDTVSDPRLISQSALGPNPAKTRPRRSLGKWAVGFAIVTVCLIALAIAGLFFTLSRRANDSDLVTNGPIPAKSIAVLPFETLSENKDDSYFADGVQDEILNSLARIAELKVISRTSVMQYRGDAKRDLRQIANALGVKNVLEGTVRRAANRVRVSIELVEARNDSTIWADSYDRDLTDIFAIQSEIAQTIAHKLTAKLSPSEQKLIEQKPTENLAAYDLYLKAKAVINKAELSWEIVSPTQPLIDSIDLLNQAVKSDPAFTVAYCAASHANDLLYISTEPTLARRALGDAAIQAALRLQPDLPDVHLAYAYHLYFCYRDYEQARKHLETAKAGLPNNPQAIELQAFMDRRQGHFQEAVNGIKAALELDPQNPEPLADLAFTLWTMRQFREAGEVYDRLISLVPDQPSLKIEKLEFVTFLETGDVTKLQAAIDALYTSAPMDREIMSTSLTVALLNRDWSRAAELVDKLAKNGGEDNGNFGFAAVPVPAGCYSILLARLQGQESSPAFFVTRDELNKKVQSSSSAYLLSALALVDALLQRNDDANAEIGRAVSMLPIEKDPLDGPCVLANSAVVHAWTGEIDKAFTELEVLAKVPRGVYYGQLKLDPLWDPLRTDARFEKLLTELAPKR
jgi:TolB-like protein/Flp pilus assembly protein TadD